MFKEFYFHCVPEDISFRSLWLHITHKKTWVQTPKSFFSLITKCKFYKKQTQKKHNSAKEKYEKKNNLCEVLKKHNQKNSHDWFREQMEIFFFVQLWMLDIPMPRGVDLGAQKQGWTLKYFL
jgi:hypothetical protein